MKNRNVIMIVVDAFFNDYLGKKKYKNSSSPFIDSIIDNKYGFSINNMYSEAPYTEAALMSLLGGCDTMDNGGHMRRLVNTDCLLKQFQNNGYTVFANCYQSSIYPSGALTGVNDLYYNASFDFKYLYDYRLYYYAELNEKGLITEDDINLIYDLLEDNFIEAINYNYCILNHSKEVDIMYDKIDSSLAIGQLEILKSEYNKFLKNKYDYVLSIFKFKKNHIIYKFYNYPTIHKVANINILLEIEKRYKHIIKKILKYNFKYNLLNNHINIKKLLYSNFSVKKNYIKDYLSCLYDKDLMDRINHKTYNTVKTIASGHSQFEHFKKWEHERVKDNPFFAYLHIDDIHFREIFFTHDTEDLNLLDSEFNRIKEYISNLPRNYKGSLAYDLGVLYVDNLIKELFLYLEKNNLLDNTDIIITADHGNSYSYLPIRENYVINNYRENYNIPCVFYSRNNLKLNMNENKYYQTKDIPATILDMENIKIPDSYTGNSLISFDGRDYAIIQYIGSGCPDIKNRPIKVGVRTKNYLVAGSVFLNDLKSLKIEEVYDLISDPCEHINIINRNNYDITKELKFLKDEIIKLQKSNRIKKV